MTYEHILFAEAAGIATLTINRPAQLNALHLGVISEMINAVDSVRDLESLLRDAAGLSKSAATALVSRAKLIFVPQGEPVGDAEQRAMKAVAERLQRMAT